MEKTALHLIRRAYGVSSLRGHQDTFDGGEASEGLDILNEILACQGQDNYVISYNKVAQFATTPGEFTYIFTQNENEPGGVIIPSRKIGILNYVNSSYPNNDVVYPVKVIDRATYYNRLRYNVQSTRPFYAYAQNFQSTNDGSEGTKLLFYPIPDLAYNIEVVYKEILGDVTLSENLDQIPMHLYRWLIYMIAQELCSIYDPSSWTQDKANTLRDLKLLINSLSDIDLTVAPSQSSYVAPREKIGSGIF